MAKEEINFEQFLSSIDVNYQDFISDLHSYLINNACKIKIELKKTGYFVSYTKPISKKSILNLLFRKKGMIARIYGENANKYIEFMNTLPDELIKSIEKAPVCKRLINPNDCNSKCSMGYSFMIKGENLQKCKCNCFMFDVNNSNNYYIKTFVENEMIARAKV